MQNQTQLDITTKIFCKLHPKMPITAICKSPFCGYYREICKTCIQAQLDHKQKSHIPIDHVLRNVQYKLKEIQKSMLILKRQKQQKLKNNPITLPFQIKEKLSSIREIINQKISLFQKTLQQRYQKEVNLKLQNLQDTIKKSLDFLKKQINEIQNQVYFQYDLRKFYINFDYWEHQQKYYKSYMEEILEKQVINFKEGFDDDNIMKLIVNFQLNLKSIFSLNKENDKKTIIQRPHILIQQKKQRRLYQIIQRNMDEERFILKPQIIDKPYPLENYKWQSPPQSIFYPSLECFYIFGEGSKPSNKILKYEDGKQTGSKKLNLVGQMLVKRCYFSICLINQQIFIIGGYNQKQGCLNKCQKLVIKQKTKVYLISSLQQRSACHNVCNFKNKFILKFGGTSIKQNQKQKYFIQGQIKQLYPQIYDIEKQQWKVVRYNIQNTDRRLQFGLWPVVVVPYENDPNKIIIFGNKNLDKKYENFSKNKKEDNMRSKFFIKCMLTRNDIELKIIEKSYCLNKKYFLFPQTYNNIERKHKSKIIAKDTSKYQNAISLVDLEEVD